MSAHTLRPLRHRLDTEWQHLATAPAARRALARWQCLEPHLAGHDDLEQLRGTVHQRHDLTAGDRALAALVRLAAAHDDELAARVVLQCLLPGATRLAKTLSVLLGGPDASEAAVLAELTVGIRTYPWQRRPRRVAANLLLDTRQRLTRAEHRWSGLVLIGLGVDETPATTGDAGIDDAFWRVETRLYVEQLLRWARRRGLITAVQEQLLREHYLHAIPMEQLVQRHHLSRSTLFHLKAGAEQRIHAAAVAGPRHG